MCGWLGLEAFPGRGPWLESCGGLEGTAEGMRGRETHSPLGCESEREKEGQGRNPRSINICRAREKFGCRREIWLMRVCTFWLFTVLPSTQLIQTVAGLWP